MSPMRTPRPRKLVLSRETVRTLAARTTISDTVVGIDTSCGEACSCACDTQTQ
ncbi:MAG TPA: hypothetical protein VF615_07255 [Longimicrobiaceae bacterium]